MVSIVVPLLNESAILPQLLDNLRCVEGPFEVIAVDGGSTDGTEQIFKELVQHDARFKILSSDSARGRAPQMNLGASVAAGDSIIFLHADCRLPNDAVRKIQQAFLDNRVVGGGFYKKYDPESALLSAYRVIANIFRTKLMKNFVGTNAIFVRRRTFLECGGYPAVPILEEVLLNDMLKKHGRLVALKPHVKVSSRRYFGFGVFRRIWVSVRVIALYRLRRLDLKTLAEMYQKSIRKN